MDSMDHTLDYPEALDAIETMTDKPGKKKRTMFSQEQKDMLEAQFATNPYPDKAARRRLALQLGVKDKSIDYWFGHRRAKTAKAKRALNGSDSDGSSSPVAVDEDADSPAPSPKRLHLDKGALSPVTVLDALQAAEQDESANRSSLLMDSALAPLLSDFDDCHDLYERVTGPNSIFREASGSADLFEGGGFSDLLGTASLFPSDDVLGGCF